MKRYILLFLLFSIGYINMYAQKKLSIKEEAAYAAKPHDELGENEAIVILVAPCKVTFSSTMDKDQYMKTMPKEKQEGDMWIYELKFPTSSRYDGRVLSIKSDIYDTLKQKLSLKSGDVLGLHVSDPFAKEYSKMEMLRDEGDAIFNRCEYAAAKDKYQEAISSFNPEMDTEDDKDAITARLTKAQTCMESQRKGDSYFDAEKWSLAFTEYEKVVGTNILDTHCESRMNICRAKRINEPRVITGIVRDNAGNTVSGATVIPGSGGKYPSNKAVKTDQSGKYVISTTYRTTKLKCWKESASTGSMEYDVIDDVVNITLRTGSSSSSSSSDSESAKEKSSSTSQSSDTKSSSSTSTKQKSAFTKKSLK